MSNSKSPPPPNDTVSPHEHAERNAARDKTSGRVSFDSRGNSVWEWKADETGKFSKDVSTQRLKKLEAPELTLEDTRRLKKIQNASPKGAPAQSGFNPYDRGAMDPKKTTGDRADFHRGSAPTMPRTVSKSDVPKSDEPRKPVKDLKRLQEWMEMKKRLAAQKDDD